MPNQSDSLVQTWEYNCELNKEILRRCHENLCHRPVNGPVYIRGRNSDSQFLIETRGLGGPIVTMVQSSESLMTKDATRRHGTSSSVATTFP